MKKLKYSITGNPGTTTENKTGTWRTFVPQVDHEVCIGCDMCNKVCPDGICFSTGLKNSKGRVYYDRDAEFCKGCALCATNCPVKAIKMVEDFK